MGVRVYKEIENGDKFERLTVICRSTRPACYPHFYWDCQCDCGTFKTVSDNKLKARQVRSCGCLRREVSAIRMRAAARIHGEAVHGQETPEFYTWTSIIARTTNPNCANWARYGALGVTICERWRNSYQTFLADVGRRPSSLHSIDRYPDPFGNYEPGNVRWATAKQQGQNRRNNHLLTINGITKCLSAWEDQYGLPPRILSRRIKYNWPIEKLFSPSRRNAAQPRVESKPVVLTGTITTLPTTTTTKTKGA